MPRIGALPNSSTVHDDARPVTPVSAHCKRHALPDILAQRTDVLSSRMARILEDLSYRE
jgi:hypothetical protein